MIKGAELDEKTSAAFLGGAAELSVSPSQNICESDITPAGRHLLSSDNKYIKVLLHRTRRGDTRIFFRRPRDVEPVVVFAGEKKKRGGSARERDREMEREI